MRSQGGRYLQRGEEGMEVTALMAFATRGPVDNPHWPSSPSGIPELTGGREALGLFAGTCLLPTP